MHPFSKKNTYLKKNPEARIVFLDAATLAYGGVDLAPLCSCGRLSLHPMTLPRNLLERCRDADIVITNKVVLDKTTLSRLPLLKLICVAATGTNNIDLDAAKRHGIAVANAHGYSTADVAEHTVLLMLALSRRLTEHAATAQNGRWQKSPIFCVTDFAFDGLAGKTLGIVGYGAIGKRVARIAKTLGMTVLVAALPGRTHAGQPRRMPLHNMLKNCDVVSLHCPLTPETKSLLNAKHLRLMKPQALLINTARGPLVDEPALANALRKNQIAGYAADVLGIEPPPRNQPLLKKSLAGKVLLTPHIAWSSQSSRRRLVAELAKNIAAFQKGAVRNRIV